MAGETAVPVVTEIIENLGGTTEAQKLVPVLKDLKELLGANTLESYVYAWLDEHGATVGYSVTDGDLSVTLS